MINDESKLIGLKIHRGKTKYMTNFNTNKKIIVDNTEIEKVEEYRYLGQNIEMKDKTLKEVQKKNQSRMVSICEIQIHIHKQRNANKSKKKNIQRMHYTSDDLWL